MRNGSEGFVAADQLPGGVGRDGSGQPLQRRERPNRIGHGIPRLERRRMQRKTQRHFGP